MRFGIGPRVQLGYGGHGPDYGRCVRTEGWSLPDARIERVVNSDRPGAYR
jgi:hypothetical protein